MTDVQKSETPAAHRGHAKPETPVSVEAAQEAAADQPQNPDEFVYVENGKHEGVALMTRRQLEEVYEKKGWAICEDQAAAAVRLNEIQAAQEGA